MQGFLAKLEEATGIKAEKSERASPLNLVEKKLLQSLVAFRDEKYDQVMQLCLEVLKLDPDNLTALKRLGSAFYALKLYPKAADAWRKALDLETDTNRRKELQDLLSSLQEQTAPKPKRHLRRAPPPKLEKPKPSGPDPKLIEDMYLRGVSLFVQRQFKEAVEVFQLILKMDPNNVDAQNALKRALKALQTEEKQ